MMSYKSYDRLTNFEYKFIHLCYRQLEQIKKKKAATDTLMKTLWMCYVTGQEKKKCYRLD